MNRLIFLILGFICISFSSKLIGQVTIFDESFDEPNGSTSGISAEGISWTSACPTCVPTNDYFEVKNGKMECQDTNGPAVWTSGNIDVSTCSHISITVDYAGDPYSQNGGIMEANTDCSGSGGCPGDPNMPISGGCANCWDFMAFNVYLDGTKHELGLIGAGLNETTYAFDIGPECSANANVAVIEVVTQTWAADENMSFDNLIMVCHDIVLDADVIVASPDSNVCLGTDLSLSTSPSYAQYSWSGPAGSSSSSTWTISNITSGDAGLYTGTFQDSDGCEYYDEINIGFTSGPLASISGGGELCLGECLDIAIEISQGQSPYILDMSIGVPPFVIPFTIPSVEIVDTFTICADETGLIPTFDQATNTVHVPQITGITGTLTLLGIMDSAGCIGTVDPTPVFLTLVDPPSSFNAGPLEACDENGNGSADFNLTDLESTINGGSGDIVHFYSDTDLTMEISSPYTTGSTTVYATVEDANCESSSVDIELILTLSPSLSAVPDENACNEYVLPPIGGSGLTGNEAYYSGPNGTGNQYFPGEIITVSTTMFIYDINGVCADEESFEILIFPGPDVFDIGDVLQCDSYTLPFINGFNLTGSEGFFTGTGGTGTAYYPGDVITGNLSLFIYDGIPGCEDEESFNIVLFDSPDLDNISDEFVCNYFVLESISGTDLSGNEAYFTGPNGSGTQYLAGDTIFTTALLYVYDVNGICSDELSFLITLNNGPVLDPVVDTTACPFWVLEVIEGTDLTGNEAYYTSTNGGGTQYNAGDTIFQSQTLYVFGGSNGCTDEESFDLSIGAGQSAGVGDTITVCVGADVNLFDILINEDPGGIFIDQDNTGALQDSIFNTTGFAGGSYVFLYQMMNQQPCPDDVAIIEVMVENELSAGLDSVISVCEGSEFDLVNLISNGDVGGNFIDENNTNALSGSIFELDSVDAGIYLFSYIVGDGLICPLDSSTFEIEWSPAPEFTSFIDTVITCSFYILPSILGENLNGEEAYYLEPGGIGTSYSEGDTLFNSGPIFTYATHLDCISEIMYELVIEPLPFAGEDMVTQACSGSSVDLSNLLINADPGGVYADLDGAGTLSGSIFNTIGLSGSSYQFSYIVQGDLLCPVDSSVLTIELVEELNAGSDASVILCQGDSINLNNVLSNADIGGVFSETVPSGGLSGNIFSTGNLPEGNYDIQYTVGDGLTCPLDSAMLTVEVLIAPSFSNISDVNTCDIYTFETIEGQNLSGNELYSSAPMGQGIIFNPGDVSSISQWIYVFDQNGSCTSLDSFYILIEAPLSAGDPVSLLMCETDVVDLADFVANGDPGGVFLDIDMTGQLSGSTFSASDLEGEVQFEYLQDNPDPCADSSAIFTITIQLTQDAGDDVSITICENDLLDLDTLLQNADLGGAYFDITGSGGLMGNMFDPAGLGGQSIEIIYSIGNGGVCPADNATIMINVNAQPQLDAIGDITICDDTYILPDIIGSNLTGNQSYFTESGGTGTELQIGSTVSDDIVLFAYDGLSSCVDESLFSIMFKQNEISVELINGSCEGEDSGTVYVEFTGNGGPDFEFYLNSGSYGAFSTYEVFLNDLPAGDLNFDIINGEGCPLNFMINVPNYQELDILSESTWTINFGESYSHEIITTGNPISIIWETQAGISCLDCFNPVFNPTSDTEYFYTITDENGCETAGSLLIQVIAEENVFIPNIFSPNNDGINDQFYIQGSSDFQISELMVFNRFGELVYFEEDGIANDPSFGWDGTFKGRVVNPGVYVYYYKIEKLGGTIQTGSGDLTVVK